MLHLLYVTHVEIENKTLKVLLFVSCTRAHRCTVLPVVSQHSNKVAATCQETNIVPIKAGKKRKNMNENNTRLEKKIKRALFMRKEVHSTFVRLQAYTQYILVSNTECKYNFCLFTRNLHRAPLMFNIKTLCVTVLSYQELHLSSSVRGYASPCLQPLHQANKSCTSFSNEPTETKPTPTLHPIPSK